MKKLFLIFLLVFLFTNRVYAKETNVLIINQIRGSETCCQAGSLDLVNAIREKNFTNELSFGWALRYDVLKNKKYLKPLRDLGEFGLLLEITPDLAKDSEVVYKGMKDGSDWYFAKNSFLIGYSKEERKKLIDTLFNSFKLEFGYYPKFTVSWMIDSWSLSYIAKTYGVRLHEITKEQYETDSYTLYGGIFNTPYYPSKNHPLLPGFGENRLDLIIVRQTVSDPLLNYGSSKAYFTSQPNDYLENPNKTDIEYFKNLLENVISQKSGFKFILLGFENSLSWDKYGLEYLKQLDVIKDLQKQLKVKVKNPTDLIFDFKKNYPENKPFYIAADFFPNGKYGALWYFGKTYRARAIIKDGKVIIDDLRNFLPIEDPYTNASSIADYAYWIVPYLIDGSQQYNLTTFQKALIEKNDLLYSNTLSDNYTDPFGIAVNSNSFSLMENEDGLEIKFLVSQKNASIKFLEDSILFENTLNPYFNGAQFNQDRKDIFFSNLFNEKKDKTFSFQKHFDFYIKAENDFFKLGWLKENNFNPLFKLWKKDNYFGLSSVFIDSLDNLAPMFQPDKSDLPVVKNLSIFYWNNKKAIAGRNPVRLFILPLNSLGRPTKIKKVEVKSNDNNQLEITYPEDYTFKVSPWFIDINAKNHLKTKVSVIVDGVIMVKDENIEFATDCKKNMSKCLTYWPQIIQYMLVILDEQKIKLISVLKQLWKV